MDEFVIGMKKREILSNLDSAILALRSALIVLLELGYATEAALVQADLDSVTANRDAIATALESDPA